MQIKITHLHLQMLGQAITVKAVQQDGAFDMPTALSTPVAVKANSIGWRDRLTVFDDKHKLIPFFSFNGKGRCSLTESALLH
jgi:hypothetical protein